MESLSLPAVLLFLFLVLCASGRGGAVTMGPPSAASVSSCYSSSSYSYSTSWRVGRRRHTRSTAILFSSATSNQTSDDVDEGTDASEADEEVNSAGYKRHALWRWVQGPAWRRAALEQEAEDASAGRIALGHVSRELLALPISQAFDPMASSPMHGKLQFSDKCSLPASVGRQLMERPFEVPWIFKVTKSDERSEGNHKNDDVASPARAVDEEEGRDAEERGGGDVALEAVYVSPLDFRAPENYVFMPQWAMQSLGLRPFDRVRVDLVRLQVAASVQLRPHDAPAWQQLITDIGSRNDGGNASPAQLLEREINKFSALTAGTNISIQLELPSPMASNAGSSDRPTEARAMHTFQVVGVRGELSGDRVALRAVRVQDADVQVNIVIPAPPAPSPPTPLPPNP